MFRPPSSLRFTMVDFLILGCLCFQRKLKIIPLTSVKEAGVPRTLQTKVTFESATVLTILIFPQTKMSLDDQILSIFFNGTSLS